MKQYKFVDLFAGCGGLSLGLQQAGFTPWFVNEIVEQFCNTYKYNHELSDEHYFVGDIAELNLHLDGYKKILSDKVKINYFYEYLSEEGIQKHEKTSPEIFEDGSLSNWPEGFFDEWDKAIDELF